MRPHIASLAVLLPLACTAPNPGTQPEPRGAPPVATDLGPSIPPTGSEPAYVGEDGTDLGGWPLRRPDQVAIVALLRGERRDVLLRWLEHWQGELEADPRKEPWAIEAFDAFAIADPALQGALDAWVAEVPESFATHAARGVWRTEMGLSARGGKLASETPKERFDDMEMHFRQARVDLEQAIALRPKAIAAHERLVAIARVGGEGDEVALRRMQAAIAQCPTCYEPRAELMESLLPRWGGSYARMDAFVAEVAPLVAEAPRLALLAGAAAADRCSVALRDEPARALAECDAALRAGEEAGVLLLRSHALSKLDRDREALADLDRALRLSPQHEDARQRRSFLRRTSGDILGGAEDLVIAYRLDPADPDLVSQVTWMVQRLRADGDALTKAGKPDEAAPYFSLASALAPDDRDIRRREAENAAAIGPDELARRVAAAPEDFDLRLQLDHALVKERRFAEIVASWDDYLARQPDDARAYKERSGAKWQGGDGHGALADMQRACDLGDAIACRDAPRMQGQLR